MSFQFLRESTGRAVGAIRDTRESRNAFAYSLRVADIFWQWFGFLTSNTAPCYRDKFASGGYMYLRMSFWTLVFLANSTKTFSWWKQLPCHFRAVVEATYYIIINVIMIWKSWNGFYTQYTPFRLYNSGTNSTFKLTLHMEIMLFVNVIMI